MKKTCAFRPDSIDSLESRLVLSRAGLAGPAQVSVLSSTVPPSHPKPTPEAARFEIRWMREMVNHHGMAIRMARLALQNSEDPGVRDLARGIIRAQIREIGQMQTWLSAGYGLRGVRPRMTADDMQMLDELGSLRGASFDRAFLGEMIGHHQQAIEDAEDLLANGFHAGLRRLGNNIITTQSAEIGRMQAMLGQTVGMMVNGSA
jgi:uncharacterized protein (DUF305 family)